MRDSDIDERAPKEAERVFLAWLKSLGFVDVGEEILVRAFDASVVLIRVGADAVCADMVVAPGCGVDDEPERWIYEGPDRFDQATNLVRGVLRSGWYEQEKAFLDALAALRFTPNEEGDWIRIVGDVRISASTSFDTVEVGASPVTGSSSAPPRGFEGPTRFEDGIAHVRSLVAHAAP